MVAIFLFDVEELVGGCVMLDMLDFPSSHTNKKLSIIFSKVKFTDVYHALLTSEFMTPKIVFFLLQNHCQLRSCLV